MKQSIRILIAVAVMATGLAACKEKAPKAPEGKQQAAMGADAQPLAEGAPAPMGNVIRGSVLETMDAGPYTYVQVDTGTEKIWAAAPKFDVAVGDRVTVPEGMPMQNYKSTTLDREFDTVYFVGAIGMGDEIPAPPPEAAWGEQPGGEGASVSSENPLPEGMHPQVDPTQAAKDSGVSFEGIKSAGKTVAEIFSGKDGLSGKEVKVRGKVVKFNAQVMGKNWIHLQDGTGAAGTNDLTITTGTVAQVGDTVVAKGKVTLNKDFGFGYKYDLIIEDAAVTVE